MATTILDRPERKTAAPPAPAAAEVLITPLLALGLVLFAIGVIDIGLAWVPLRFGNAEWEFGTVSRTYDGLALGTIGFVLLTCAAALTNYARYLRTLSVVAALVLLFLLAITTIYGLSVTVALGAVPEQTQSLIKRAVARTSCFAVLYIGLYGWLVWFTWRRAGAATRGSAK